MIRLIPTLLAILAACLFAAGCGGSNDKNKNTGNAGGNQGHGHDHDHDHGHEHAGEKMDLGSKDAGGARLAVTQFGHIEAGASEWVFEIAATGTKVDKMRGWFGGESPADAMPAAAANMGEGDWDLHIEGSKTIPEGAKLYLEVTIGDKTHTVSFDAKMEDDHDHDHDHGDDHDHD